MGNVGFYRALSCVLKGNRDLKNKIFFFFCYDHKQTDDKKVAAGLAGRGGGWVLNGHNREVSIKWRKDFLRPAHKLVIYKTI